MPDDKYKYDVFISYSSPDRPWAEKLYRALKEEKQLEVFFDQERLETGNPWEPQLIKALEASQHLVMLWSNNAQISPWVNREVYSFVNDLDRAAATLTGVQRRFIPINLEGENRALSRFQAINELRAANSYAQTPDKGAQSVAQQLWQSVVNAIANAIRKDDPAIPVLRAVLAIKADEIGKLDEAPADLPTLPELLQKLELGDRTQLGRYYGAQREDWKPFRGEKSARQILDGLLTEVNTQLNTEPYRKRIGERRFRWEPLPPEFWTNRETANQVREQLAAGTQLAVCVIDPISLYSDLVLRRLNMLTKSFAGENVLVATLAPFRTPSLLDELSKTLQQFSLDFINDYFNPPLLRSGSYVNLGFNLSDDQNLKRLINLNLGSVVSKFQQPNQHTFLRQ